MMSNLPLMLPAYAEILLLASACVILIADLFIPDKRRLDVDIVSTMGECGDDAHQELLGALGRHFP